MNPERVLALRRAISHAVDELVEEALRVNIPDKPLQGHDEAPTADVGDRVRVRDVGFGRPPAGRIVRTYENGEYEVLLLSGHRRDERVRVKLVERGVARTVEE